MRKGLGIALLAAVLAWSAMAVQITGAQAADKLNVAEAGGAVFRLPFYIAVQNGFFKDEGLDLTIVETRTGSDSMKMLAGNSVDLVVGQLIDAVQVAKQGIPVHGVAMLTNRFTNSILVRSDLADQIKSLKDLKGQVYGVTGVGSGTWQFAVFAAIQEGLKVEDLNIVGVGVNANVIGAMKSKRVAVMSYAEPETLMLVDDGTAKMLIDAADPATHARLFGAEYLDDWVIASPDFAKAHPAEVLAFVKGIQKALNWLAGHNSEEAAQLLAAYPAFQGMDAKYLAAAVKRMGVPKTAVVTQGAYDSAIKLPLTVGALDKLMPFDQLVDNSFATQAAKAYPPKP